MPRHASNGHSSTRPDFSERPRGQSGRSSGDGDEQVLRLRETGASYSAVARSLGLRRALDAHRAFVRAVNKREGDERHQLVTREMARLDQLEIRIRQRDAGDDEKVERRLLALQRLREALP